MQVGLLEAEALQAWSGGAELVHPMEVQEVALTEVLVQLSRLPITLDSSDLERAVNALARRLATIRAEAA